MTLVLGAGAFAAAQAVMRQATRFALAAPKLVPQMVAGVTPGRASVAQALQTLMTRPLKEE